MKCPHCDFPRAKRISRRIPTRKGKRLPHRQVVYYRCPKCKKNCREYRRVIFDTPTGRREQPRAAM